MAGRGLGRVKESTMIYRKGSLFKAAEPGAVLVHACNTQGSWGAGIAAQFKKKYPQAYNDYKNWCEKYPDELIGSYIKLKDKDTTIGCLFTSSGYGDKKDPQETILENTRKSIQAFIHTLPYRAVVNSPKINAGLFKVPWKETEKIIKTCLLERNDITWVIWEG